MRTHSVCVVVVVVLLLLLVNIVVDDNAYDNFFEYNDKYASSFFLSNAEKHCLSDTTAVTRHHTAGERSIVTALSNSNNG
jgi:hypothetical protein